MGRPTDYNEDILNKAKAYLEKPRAESLLPSVAGLAIELELSRSTIYDWASQEDKKEFSDILERLLAKQEKELTENGLLGEFNSTITKLMLTKHGYSDKQETDLTSKGEKINILFDDAFSNRKEV